jgi:hypothetical protein
MTYTNWYKYCDLEEILVKATNTYPVDDVIVTQILSQIIELLPSEYQELIRQQPSLHCKSDVE